MAIEWKGCTNCKYLKTDKGFYCVAFPNGVPLAIASGDVKHDKVLPGQTGKAVWTPVNA